jgi:RNA ligase
VTKTQYNVGKISFDTAAFVKRLDEWVNANAIIDLERMDALVKQKLVRQVINNQGLALYNYTPQCVYEKKWDAYTRMARGLVVSPKGTIVNRPFEKFFNLEEHGNEPVPDGHIEVYEKVDGSFISASCSHEWGLVVASRGSFTSDQARHARELIVRSGFHEFMLATPHHTFCFEVIYPANRIVVNYGDADELVLLGVNTAFGQSVPYDTLLQWNLPFRLAQQVGTISHIGEAYKLKSHIQTNEEGYVLYWPRNGFRLKLKGDEYLRLHRIVTNTNNKTVWEMCKQDMSFEQHILNVPDEFMWWVKKTRQKFYSDYATIEEKHLKLFDTIKARPRPQFAEGVEDAVRNDPSVLPALLFRMKDNRSYNELIWNALKPTELERPPVGETE